MSARILDVTPAAYHNDPCAVPSLSQSIATTLLTKSPAHAWTEHPRFGNRAREATAATDQGELIHALLLGKGTAVEIIAADNFRTKLAQQLRDAAIEAGKIPMLERQYRSVEAAAETLRGNLASEFGIEFNGRSEVPIEWDEPGADGPVTCRGLLDHVILDDGRILDLKSTRNSHPQACARHVLEFGYDIQHAAYTSAVAALRPDLAGRIDMQFVFVELSAPYAIVPARLDGTLREIGHERWQRAVRIWERCLRTNHWPAYAQEIVTLEAPAWALSQAMGDRYAEQ